MHFFWIEDDINRVELRRKVVISQLLHHALDFGLIIWPLNSERFLRRSVDLAVNEFHKIIHGHKYDKTQNCQWKDSAEIIFTSSEMKTEVQKWKLTSWWMIVGWVKSMFQICSRLNSNWVSEKLKWRPKADWNSIFFLESYQRIETLFFKHSTQILDDLSIAFNANLLACTNVCWQRRQICSYLSARFHWIHEWTLPRPWDASQSESECFRRAWRLLEHADRQKSPESSLRRAWIEFQPSWMTTRWLNGIRLRPS